MAQWLERLPHNRKVVGSSPGRVIPKTFKKWYSLASCLALDKLERSWEVKQAELPVNQPSPAVAFTAFADPWSRAIATEIGAALCAIGVGKDFDFFIVKKASDSFLTIGFIL